MHRWSGWRCAADLHQFFIKPPALVYLPAAVYFVPAGIVHRLTVERSAMRYRRGASGRKWAVVTMTVIEAMIDMAVEVIPAMIPGTGSDKHAVCEPLRPVIAVRRAVIGWSFVIAIGADWRAPRNTHTYREVFACTSN